MIKRWVAAAAAMVLVSAAGTASAATISSWVGNANGFGPVLLDSSTGEMGPALVIPSVDAQGFDEFPLYPSSEAGALVPAAGTGDSYEQGTDLWTAGGLSVTHTYGSLTGITRAKLSLFSGGWGLDGLAEVFVNTTSVGFLSDGDDPDPSPDPNFYHFAYLDEFEIGGSLLDELLAGMSATVRISAFNGSDGGVLDYSLLTFDAGAVPEPTSWALTALALAGLVASRRRQAR